MQASTSMRELAEWFRKLDAAAPSYRLDKGQLDLRPPSILLQSGINELESGNLAYSRAIAPLVKAAKDDFKLRRGLSSEGSAVIVTHGIIGGLSCLFRTQLRPGDQVLVPTPCWPAIASLVSAAAGIPLGYSFKSQEDADALPDRIAGLINERTRFVVVNAPSNPLGLVPSLSSIEATLKVASKAGIKVVWDDAYESFGPTGPDIPMLTAQLSGAESVILLTSVSKRFAAPGLRVGLMRCPLSMEAQLWEECLLQTGGVSRIAQSATAQLLREGSEFAREVANTVIERRKVLCDLIGSERLVNEGKGHGMYVMTHVPAGSSGIEFSMKLLRSGLGAVPGEFLGLPNTIRLSLSTDAPNLARAAHGFQTAWADC